MVVDRDHLDESDEELARRSQAGSSAAFEALVCRHHAALYRFLFGCARHEADARDLTQVAFVAAFRAIGQYRPSRPFAPWLFTIARRKFLDYLRRRRPGISLESVPEPVCTWDPSCSLGAQEDRAGLWRRVRELVSIDQFQALWLFYHDDLSLQDIARVLGRTETSVKVMLFRARRLLAQRLSVGASGGVPSGDREAVWRMTAAPQALTGRSR